jgi:DNA-binding LytR/AlgR family response regulator
LGTDLVFIKSEDHYLEVHTTAGSSLIKMRFSDAISELGERGIKVHRSYWVATRHVIRSVRTGKQTVLRLTGDHRVPVSVTHLRAVRTILSG